MSFDKTIRSRSNKNVGDIIEEKWEITAKTVIAEPQPGNPHWGVAPRLGIYEYEVKPTVQSVAPTRSSSPKPKQRESDMGGTRREASAVPLTVRRIS